MAIDCAITLRKLVYQGINSVIKDYGYDDINIRIGLDSGEASIMTIGNAETKQHKDIIGSVVSLAAKIQNTAEAGGINLGEITLRNLHTGWRLICTKINLPANWKYQKENGEPYQIYKVGTA